MRHLEHHRATRFPCAVELEMEWGSAVLRGRIRNASASGMFIESDDPLWIGAGFSARVIYGRPFRLNCSVRRIEPGRGMGVAVALAEPNSRQDFHDFLEALSQTPAQDDSPSGPPGNPPAGAQPGP
jgi:hypothetical protein